VYACIYSKRCVRAAAYFLLCLCTKCTKYLTYEENETIDDEDVRRMMSPWLTVLVGIEKTNFVGASRT
jgi:hypothetical protein